MSKVKISWKQIEAWYEINVPADQFFLAGGATDEAIDKVQSDLGVAFPEDLRESYRLHDGSGSQAVFAYGFHLLSLEEIVESWNMWRNHVLQGLFENVQSTPEGPIKSTWWNLKWMPVTHNSGGDHQLLDMDPDKGGTVGQIVDFSHEAGALRVLASSFGDWLLQFSQDLKNGKYRFDENDLWLVPVGV